MTARLRSALWVVTATVCVIILVLVTTIAEPLPPLPIDPFWLAWIGLAVVGAFILVKRPGNLVGGIVLAIGVCAALSAGSNLAAVHGWAGADYLVVINQLAFAPLFVLLPLLILVFPSGKLPSPRWHTPSTASNSIRIRWASNRSPHMTDSSSRCSGGRCSGSSPQSSSTRFVTIGGPPSRSGSKSNGSWPRPSSRRCCSWLGSHSKGRASSWAISW